MSARQPAVIAPSILSANFAALGADVDAVLDAQPRMADSPRSNRFSSVVEAEPVAAPRIPDPAPPPPNISTSNKPSFVTTRFVSVVKLNNV